MSVEHHDGASRRRGRGLRAGTFPVALLLALSASACGPAPRPVQPADAYGADGDAASGETHDGSVGGGAAAEQTPESSLAPAELPGGGGVAEGKGQLAEGTPVAPPVARPLAELASFYDALDALRSQHRDESVRVLWLGDSHTAADFMTAQVRAALQELGGDGGPGFVRLGLDGYRHDQVRLESKGKWRKAPVLPAQRTRVLDGVFGYGGIRTIPTAGAVATARLRQPAASKGQVTNGGNAPSDAKALSSGAAPSDAKATSSQVHWTLAYRLGEGGSLSVRLGEQSTVTPTEPSDLPGGIQYLKLVGEVDDTLTVAHRAGSPEVFGVFIDRAEKGVVLDTAGINGARAATPLAWEPEQFASAVHQRDPDLLVLAYGTNEAFDNTNPDRYSDHIEKLVALVRRGAPDIPCWVVGPPDAAGGQGQSRARVLSITEVQRAAAQHAGCAFSSAFELMGGEGSYYRWQHEKPALARGDGIHLTISGYRELGDRLAGALLRSESTGPDESSRAEARNSSYRFMSAR